MCKRVQRKDAVYGDDDDDRWQVVMIQLVGFLVVSIQLGSKNSSIQIVSRNIKILPETSQCSKIFSLVASFYAAVYVPKEKAYFPPKNRIQLKVVMSASAEVLQMYLAWRQQVCETF
ncbi:hypothetical protein HID58_086052 [Brassica napus]|uniref:Uncharacterized protein n=1 Tax=Brassica napus TaxID=3708 RepID=A0ABQ7XPB5_BRANA|nr:hypothetical protein HID58_086048 [Brassica napus]KAH0857791.1 hypothetical protein HID58_086052 [Brassica napus]